MANIRHFGTCGGNPVRLDKVGERVAHGVSGVCPACGGFHKVERAVEMRANPSRHECDARCMNATGRIMRCECACGGKNHGHATFAAAPSF